MKSVLSISFAELSLKGGNRQYFEKLAIRRILNSIKEYEFQELYKEQGKVYIEVEEDKMPMMIKEIQKVFGIHHINPAYRVEKNIKSIEEGIIRICEKKARKYDKASFKIVGRRNDKSFFLTSPEINQKFGAFVLKNFPWTVDVHNPDIVINIEIREHVYIYAERYEGFAGLPIGSSGSGLLLLSGGIDSPVAGFLMASRGMNIDGLHFHSYPFTSERGEDKVKRLAKILAQYTGKFRFFSVNLLPIQKAINENCNPREMTILSRRFMMRIGEKIAKDYNYDAVVTGESLGQVASQTIESMNVIEKATDMTILRPLIAMDKEEITEVAKDVGSYDISIEPFLDSCTVFLPDKPVTKPKLSAILKSEEKLNVEKLVDEAVENVKIYWIDGED